MPQERMLITILHCARCGADHKDMEFSLFNGNPIIDPDGTTWDWWGICPVTSDPVLLHVIPDTDEPKDK